jgi:hypothetical protein
LRPFISINYAYIVAFAPCSQRASFWGVTMSLHYSTTIKLLPLTKLITGSYPSLRTSLRCWEVIISLVSDFTMVRKFMQGRHAGQYLQSKRSPIPANVGYGLLTVGGFLTVLNIKTTSKCSIAGIFLIKGITQHYPRY